MPTGFSLGVGLSSTAMGRGGSPITILGSSLLAWWTADRADLITLSGSAVTSWKDVVGGYDFVQAVSAARPIYSATSFGGVPGVTSDATDDEMTITPIPATLPTGATAGEAWAIDQQNVAAADTGTKFPFSYGNGSTSDRRMRRGVVTGVNRAGVHVGTGASQVTVSDGVVDFSSRHVVRNIFGATESSVQIDGGALSTVAGVPATAGNRIRMFCSAASTGTGFAGMTRRDLLFTTALTAAQIAALQAWALPRRML